MSTARRLSSIGNRTASRVEQSCAHHVPAATKRGKERRHEDTADAPEQPEAAEMKRLVNPDYLKLAVSLILPLVSRNKSEKLISLWAPLSSAKTILASSAVDERATCFFSRRRRPLSLIM